MNEEFGSVEVVATHASSSTCRVCKIMSRSLTVETLKDKLYPLMGTAPANMEIMLHKTGEKAIDMSATLGSLAGEDSRLEITVVDTDPTSTMNQLARAETHIAEEAKFVLDEDKYNQRTDTFRHMKRTGAISTAPQQEETLPTNIKIGNRCQVIGTNTRGTVKYIGKVSFAHGYWIGVELDEPLGKSDGKGYFACKPLCGAFYKAGKLEVGDFPELELDLDDEL
ncbi:tubulin-folding cofactor B [Pelomyxa schiedti]|nr:tubulin-folding cofactor B [Pelomyxa schiedti]